MQRGTDLLAQGGQPGRAASVRVRLAQQLGEPRPVHLGAERHPRLVELLRDERPHGLGVAQQPQTRVGHLGQALLLGQVLGDALLQAGPLRRQGEEGRPGLGRQGIGSPGRRGTGVPAVLAGAGVGGAGRRRGAAQQDPHQSQVDRRADPDAAAQQLGIHLGGVGPDPADARPLPGRDPGGEVGEGHLLPLPRGAVADRGDVRHLAGDRQHQVHGHA